MPRDRTWIEIDVGLWMQLHRELSRRGERRRETGAFLLGYRDSAWKRRIVEPAYYDDLDPQSCRFGYIQFAGACYGRLWEICRAKELEVVADMHTHPGLAFQSLVDRENPMMPHAGHVAFILPWFATRPDLLGAVGIYRYLGEGEWKALSRQGQAPKALVLTTRGSP